MTFLLEDGSLDLARDSMTPSGGDKGLPVVFLGSGRGVAATFEVSAAIERCARMRGREGWAPVNNK